jgi:nucleoside-diphosphate-sugar epimerase
MSKKLVTNDDYLEILESTKEKLKALKDKSIFFTGATGFFGKWLSQFLIRATTDLNLNTSITILCRDTNKSIQDQPWLATKNIKLIQGDVKNFEFPNDNFDYFIHAATAASAVLNTSSPEVMADTIIEGTKRVLNLAERCSKPRFLFVSSGAVYGQQPPEIALVNESLLTGPDVTKVTNSYAEAKRMAELYCQFYANSKKIDLSVARCYAFLGPYLPLDQHFAAGNFLRDVLEKKVITLSGDGSPYRSYMYPTDLVNWLLTILIDAPSGEVYNVGSEEEIQLKDLANLINEHRLIFNLGIDHSGVVINKKPDVSAPRNAYVPSVEKASIDLNLKVSVNLREAISRTLKWHLIN